MCRDRVPDTTKHGSVAAMKWLVCNLLFWQIFDLFGAKRCGATSGKVAAPQQAAVVVAINHAIALNNLAFVRLGNGDQFVLLAFAAVSAGIVWRLRVMAPQLGKRRSEEHTSELQSRGHL